MIILCWRFGHPHTWQYLKKVHLSGGHICSHWQPTTQLARLLPALVAQSKKKQNEIRAKQKEEASKQVFAS